MQECSLCMHLHLCRSVVGNCSSLIITLFTQISVERVFVYVVCCHGKVSFPSKHLGSCAYTFQVHLCCGLYFSVSGLATLAQPKKIPSGASNQECGICSIFKVDTSSRLLAILYNNWISPSFPHLKWCRRLKSNISGLLKAKLGRRGSACMYIIYTEKHLWYVSAQL